MTRGRPALVLIVWSYVTTEQVGKKRRTRHEPENHWWDFTSTVGIRGAERVGGLQRINVESWEKGVQMKTFSHLLISGNVGSMVIWLVELFLQQWMSRGERHCHFNSIKPHNWERWSIGDTQREEGRWCSTASDRLKLTQSCCSIRVSSFLGSPDWRTQVSERAELKSDDSSAARRRDLRGMKWMDERQEWKKEMKWSKSWGKKMRWQDVRFRKGGRWKWKDDKR